MMYCIETLLTCNSLPLLARRNAGGVGSADARIGGGAVARVPAHSPTVVIIEPRQSLLMDNIEQWGQSVHSATTSPSALLRSASGESLCSKITEDEDPLLSRPGASLSLASFYSAHTAVTDFTDCIDHADAFDQGVEVEASTAQSFDKGVKIEASA